jgi:OOP family OmpA-OmpF porin
MTTAVLHEQSPVQVAATRPPAPEPEPEPEPPARVTVEAERIRVDEKIHFEIGSAEISAESDSLLSEIAQVMNDNPHVRKVRIEGHTDNQGAAPYNLDLSRRRARAVRERLIANGVEAGRLESQGYGLTRPIETNDTDAGRAANRRVEFNILEQDATVEAPAEGQAQTPQVTPPAQGQANPAAPGPTVRTGGQAAGGAR